MKAKTTRVIVANGDTARVFELRGRNTPLVPLEGHVWKAPAVNDYADDPGMSHSRVGPSQHRMDPRTASEDLALDAFARDTGERLLASLRKGEFEQLVIVAAPRLMGFLRNHLDTSVRATIWMEIDKDFTHLPLEKLGETLKSHLYS
ncbi:host attachment protein [Ovoidimarina sediminis]|uniref:host attachment protein n=1 Tax=Ovoidimarina sediminis TaxID=3079856 RepID=UPI00290BA630|nr:host attachment protein [Rhodophyticola sp. MJ-SS7]MDU8944197.1 host attachment protein [Rhodophyticola sp. MJ-SS7]